MVRQEKETSAELVKFNILSEHCEHENLTVTLPYSFCSNHQTLVSWFFLLCTTAVASYTAHSNKINHSQDLHVLQKFSCHCMGFY